MTEEVADEALGALIQILEVGRELGIGVSAEMRRCSDTDLKCSIDKKEKRLTRGEDGAAEEHQKNLRRHACCWPFAQRKEERLGFLESLRKKKAKKALANGETIVPMG